MKVITALVLTASLAALAGCNDSAREQKADNVEASAENMADALEESADNAATDAAEEGLENKADATREAGDAAAEDVRTNDPDTNVANGM